MTPGCHCHGHYSTRESVGKMGSFMAKQELLTAEVDIPAAMGDGEEGASAGSARRCLGCGCTRRWTVVGSAEEGGSYGKETLSIWNGTWCGAVSVPVAR